jgi:SecD/SecF fusion protein
LFGGEAIRGFMFALIVGVLVGTYSSMFIATPIMFDTLSKKK